MTQNPLLLPPSPARRELMREQGYNIGPDDYTDEEWTAIEAETAAHHAAGNDRAAS